MNHVLENFLRECFSAYSPDTQRPKGPGIYDPFYEDAAGPLPPGLGWMLGKRFMQLTYVGRRSGKVYCSVLAVLRYDRDTHEILVVSPWSESNWYRNIQASPALEVETGRVRYAPVQRNLSPERSPPFLSNSAAQHPIFSRMVARIPGWKIDLPTMNSWRWRTPCAA